MFYDDDGVYVLLKFHLVDRFPSLSEIKDSLYPYRVKAAEFIINNDLKIMREHATIEDNYESVKEIEKECIDYMIDIPDTLVKTQIVWRRIYKKRIILWFFKNVYDYQIKVYWPLYSYHRGLKDVLLKHYRTEDVQARAFAKLYMDYLDAKIKPVNIKKIE